jgi:hypothetical protein
MALNRHACVGGPLSLDAAPTPLLESSVSADERPATFNPSLDTIVESGGAGNGASRRHEDPSVASVKALVPVQVPLDRIPPPAPIVASRVSW